MFQGERPMVPFLGDELHSILRSLMARFIKDDLLKEADTALKLLKINCEDVKNQKECKKVDIGFAASATLLAAPKTVSDLQKMAFRTGCCKFLAGMTAKLLERSPLQFSLVRNLNCLSPKKLASSPEKCKANFKKVLEVLLAKKHFEADHCDKAGRQFAMFCDEVVKKEEEMFLSFKETKQNVTQADRLDDFYSKFLGMPEEHYSELWDVIKFCLILSHGQATVESGFSVNKQMLVENLSEDTLVAKRRVHEAVQAAGGLQQITITPSMMTSVRAARARYHEYLDSEKEKKVVQATEASRKRKQEELSAMKEKRRRLEADMISMNLDADKFAEQAENTSKLTLLAKSNALRRGAKSKKAEIQKLDDDIIAHQNA